MCLPCVCHDHQNVWRTITQDHINTMFLLFFLAHREWNSGGSKLLHISISIQMLFCKMRISIFSFSDISKNLKVLTLKLLNGIFLQFILNTFMVIWMKYFPGIIPNPWWEIGIKVIFVSLQNNPLDYLIVSFVLHSQWAVFFIMKLNRQTFNSHLHIISKDQIKTNDLTKSGLNCFIMQTKAHWGDSILHSFTRKSQITNFFVRSPVEINRGINTISYCGNTSKSDWLAGAGKQIHYSEQRVILRYK